MIVDLVRVTTADGVRLDGACQRPSGEAQTAPLPIDAILCVHGTGGSFYTSTLFEGLAGRMLARGATVLRVNTRGHDLVSTAVTSKGGKRQGAAYEAVDDCRHDLRAWLDWLAAQGFRRVCLAGHSLGAVKAVYSLARGSHEAGAALVAISPPRLSHSWFAASTKRDEFQGYLATAAEHVQSGRGETLLDVRFPLPFLVTAAGYLEKYGPDERYNFLPLVDRVACPALYTFGGEEVERNVAFNGLPEAVEQAAGGRQNVRVAVVPDADHFYSRHGAKLIAEIEAWLESLSRDPQGSA
ncbi:MAG: alpha/beta fold hydrolase [Planctomycetes bacterium]|nr:alpha/beta fold hydrolase [Planctomycetota bacterium]